MKYEMKTMICARRYTLAFLCVCVSLSALPWGQKGHDVVAKIAENYLTPKTYLKISDINQGYLMVNDANWPDTFCHTEDGAFTKTWHYKNIDKGVKYEDAPLNADGDVVRAIRKLIETAKTEAAKDSINEPVKIMGLTQKHGNTMVEAFVPEGNEELQFIVRMLVHLVADLHQPMHMGHASDRGGNGVKVKFFGRQENLHSIWDSALVERAHNWSYTEWAENIDTPLLRYAVCKQGIGAEDIDSWAKESHELATAIYAGIEETESKKGEMAQLGYDYVAHYTPYIEQRLLAAGMRLAIILNDIFDPAD